MLLRSSLPSACALRAGIHSWSPLYSALALATVAGALSSTPAQAQVQGAWFAQGNSQQFQQHSQAARQHAARAAHQGPDTAQQQTAARAQLAQSLDNLNRTAHAIAAQQAAQNAARMAAMQQASDVADGLALGGLEVASGDKALWQGASAPVASSKDGHHTVAIAQTEPKAILNWNRFDVGRNTTVEFQQKNTDAVLNRVVGDQVAPSQIQGRIKGDGTVMVVNQNGVVFSGTSQVNVRNLVAAAADIDNTQFSIGLYGANAAATFTAAVGKVLIEQGAQISTAEVADSTTGGGYVLVVGKEVHNTGNITTPGGQTALAGGDSFVIKKGQGTDGNLASSTRGNVITVAGEGRVSNRGLISASKGDITLTGNHIEHAGVLLASTSVHHRGTVHLNSGGVNAIGENATVTLTGGAAIAILLDESTTALDSQRESLFAPVNDTSANPIVPADIYRRDLSLVEITSSGTVDFQNGSITLATGGQVAVKADQRTLVRDGSIIDVSGAIGVKVAMESNSIQINVQGNEMRDAQVNRDSNPAGNNSHVSNSDVWVDVRELVFVPAGTNGYNTDRWYTAGGLLEVGGYLGSTPHGAGEWMAQGGTVSFTGTDLITQQGSQINVSGGTLDVQDGFIRQSWLRGADNRLYEVSRAPGDLMYISMYQGYEDHSLRWEVTRTFNNPLIGPRRRFEQGYTVGRNAGRLIVGTRNAVLEGDIVGNAYQGVRQIRAAQAGVEGYYQPQNVTPQRGQLTLGTYTPYYDKDIGTLEYVLGANANTLRDVFLSNTVEKIAAAFDLDTALPEGRKGSLHLDALQLNGVGLGAVRVAALGGIVVGDALEVAPGGEIVLYGPAIEVHADLIAHSGSIHLGNVLYQIADTGGSASFADSVLHVSPSTTASMTVARGVTIDVAGLWSNLRLHPNNIANLPYQDGGRVSVRSTGEITVAQDSLIDVSSGATMLADGSRQGGRGGSVVLAINHGLAGGGPAGFLTMQGDLRAYGVQGGGNLKLQADRVLINSAKDTHSPEAGTLLVDSSFFNKGFSHYEIIGLQGVTVATATRIDVGMPVLRIGIEASRTASGDPGAALEVWTPDLYMEDPIKAQLIQRRGASLALRAGSSLSTLSDVVSVTLDIGRGASINVDPGLSIDLRSIGQLRVNGTLNAWGGEISLRSISLAASEENEKAVTLGHNRSLQVGTNAVLDASSRAISRLDSQGKRYGLVADGGRITLGGQIDPDTGLTDGSDQFVLVEQGARLQASGSQMMIDLPAFGFSRGMGADLQSTMISGAGGSISLASLSGLYVEGDLIAHAGGAGAAGGTLSIALDSGVYAKNLSPDRVLAQREMIMTQNRLVYGAQGTLASVAGGDLTYGNARVSVSLIDQGGFDAVELSAPTLSFGDDIALSLGRSLSLYAAHLALGGNAPDTTTVSLTAPYLRLAGHARAGKDHYTLPDQPSSVSNTDQISLAEFALHAGLIDVRNMVRFGAASSGNSTGRRGFAHVALHSTGDLRFLKADSSEGAVSALNTNGRMSLRSAQIYPASNAVATLSAAQIDISRAMLEIPAMPDSAFGHLTFDAPIVNQGGVLRAPLGSIHVGTTSGYGGTLDLLADSITSISGAGLQMPYGGTVDGVMYVYNGSSIASLLSNNNLGRLILKSEVVNVESGAVVDISGGGELVGAGFVSGRGGSTDARFHPLIRTRAGGFTLPSLAENPVYAIVPGPQRAQAPVGEPGPTQPLVGQQITLQRGVAGLPAGTYTLLPSTYALLPGAFRIEIPTAPAGLATGTVAMRNGSYISQGVMSLAGTAVRDNSPSQVILTPADVLRSYSQYNEISFSAFVMADAARLGAPVILLPQDGKRLTVGINQPVYGFNRLDDVFNFDGKLRSDGAGKGQRGITEVDAGFMIEIVAEGAPPTGGFTGATLRDTDLNAIAAGGLSIGGRAGALYGQGGNQLVVTSSAQDITLRSGAMLRAPSVFLIAKSPAGGITVEQGAGIVTLGQGAATQDSSRGYVFSPGSSGVLAVSNGRIDLLPNTAYNPQSKNDVPAAIRLGVCGTVCEGTTQIYSEGAITLATYSEFELSDAVRYGTRHLGLAVGGINTGTTDAMETARAQGMLPAGLTLNQDLLTRLLQGDTGMGAPALETLSLAAREGMRFYGNVTLDTYSAAGLPMLHELVLTTPALYGAGGADDIVTLRTSSLIWNGSTQAPSAVVQGGAGNGDGILNIDADTITLGYSARAQTKPLDEHARLILGFSTVNLMAKDRITGNHKGSLAVNHKQGPFVEGIGHTYSGGNLNLVTPMLTGGAGAVTHINAGGDLRASWTSVRMEPSDVTLNTDALGAELALSARQLWVDTEIVLPSGKLLLKAEQDVTLADGAQLDLAGRAVAFNDLTRYSWGGDVTLESRHGNLVQTQRSRINVSASYNNAGTLKAVALNSAAGTVSLQGQILGAATGHYDASGTDVPYRAGGIDIRAQNMGGPLDAEFAALNQRLNDGQVFGSRQFQLKQGSLVIGDGLTANEINVSVDGGSLTVTGTIAAGGERVGAIRLAGKQGLTLAGTAVLDVHGSVLRVDSYGKIIESPNRAIVELRAGDGVLTLANGAHIDLRYGTATGQHDGRLLGTLSMYAPRFDAQGRSTELTADNDPFATPDAATYGDIGIDARGNVLIDGAKSIALYAVQRDDKAPDGMDLTASGNPYQVITQDYLDRRHNESTLFVDTALANASLMNGKLAGLNNATYRDVFHLRPGLELVSKSAEGDLIVQGDLDLSGHRYASINPTVRGYVAGTQPGEAAYGAGESGKLSIRAGGNLEVYGSINDGFVTPPVTQDDDGWLLVEGKQPFGGDVVVPGNNVVLQPGTAFEFGKVLNYPLPIVGATLLTGTLLPTDATLAGTVTFAAGTVLGGTIYNIDGSVAHAAGSLLQQDITLQAGMQLGAGIRLSGNTSLAAMTWPAGVALPEIVVASQYTIPTVTLSTALALRPGSLIPSQTDVKLAGGESIALRTPDSEGNHGRNWALAQMLPEDSQSWSIQLVAGADQKAADPRLTNPGTQAMLRLADTHYGMKGLPSGILIWSASGAIEMTGDASLAGTPITFDAGSPVEGWPTFCTEYPEYCESASYVWTADGLEQMGGDPGLVGTPIAFTSGPAAYFDTMCSDYPDFCSPASTGFETERGGSRTSVVRTGTGDLELISGGDLRMDSLYGVYTAGMPTSVDAAFNQPRGRASQDRVQIESAGMYESLVDGGPDSLYQAWYPDHGGNVLLSAGGDLSGDILANLRRWSDSDLQQAPSSAVGNWLWRQGTGNALSATNSVPTAWWINFGTYASVNESTTALVGFTGIGTLGGGNLDVRVGDDAGAITWRGDRSTSSDQLKSPRSQGLVLVVGSTGRVGQDGTFHLTGGGDLALRVGGGINASLSGRNVQAPVHDLQGSIVNLRGATLLQAGAVGGIDLIYGSDPIAHDAKEVRGFDAYSATRGSAAGGPIMVPGDSVMSLNTRGDLVLGAAADAGRVTQRQSLAFTLDDGTQYSAGGNTWFSLWTPHTAINLFSAGGNVTPGTQIGQLIDASRPNEIRQGEDASPSDGRIVYPSILRVVAAQGSIYYGSSAYANTANTASADSVVLAPSPRSELSFLARESIYGSGYVVSASSAAESALATPQQPGFVGTPSGYLAPVVSNQSVDARVTANLESGRFPLFAFGSDVPAGNTSNAPARFYAIDGDIIGLRAGERVLFRDGSSFHVGAGPVRIMAGRDIVNSGTPLGRPSSPSTFLPESLESYGNLFVHNANTDISLVSAGRDVLYSSFEVAGPGALVISAGRDIRMDDRASVVSLGAVSGNDTRRGADIVMMAGVGREGPNYQAVLKRYLDPANRLTAAMKTYQGRLSLREWLTDEYGYTGDDASAQFYMDELQARLDTDTSSQPRRILANDYRDASQLHLVNWMEEHHDYKGADENALTAFQTLAPEQQAILARQLYYAELREGGREYNDVGSARHGSYLRGREAIATLFPYFMPSGEPQVNQGDITMYGSAGVNTLFGGDIQMLTPSGQQVFGIEGEPPVALGVVTPGVVTQGTGNIHLYSLGSILLGQSRIMTTFGGDILAWSAQGDINAGRGSKTTVVHTPPRRVYDSVGNVTLSPTVPSTGAGIATLAPIPEVPSGDIDLIAPLGTIDAGEAGIRVSGNVNIAALHVVNAENIQVQGESKGMPVVAAVNVGALTSASSAASSAATAAQETIARARSEARSSQPSQIQVQVLGFGSEQSSAAQPTAASAAAPLYQPDSIVRVLGLGEHAVQAQGQLNEQERSRMVAM